MYIAAFLLSLGVAGLPQCARHRSERHPLAALTEVFGYVWSKPELLCAFSMAFLVNLLAYPFFLGLLPYVAKDIYVSGQAGLGYIAAAYAVGGLAGSLVVGANRLPLRAARTMLAGAAAWFVTILLFGQVQIMAVGLALLFVAGVVQSLCLVPLAAVMLRSSAEEMRGRVMGMRQLAVWGLPLGLLAAGALITRFGFAATTLLYTGLGLAATLAIGYRWRRALWERDAPANARI